MINPNYIKNQFPFFVNNPEIVYLDSSATTQKPKQVIDSIVSFYEQENSNAGRSSYKMASKLTTKVEVVREKVKNFLKANSKSEILFSSGATDSFNKIAQMIGFTLQDGDEILYSPEDHKSFVLPWFSLKNILKKFGITINLIPYETRLTGGANILDLLNKVSKRTKVINITHIHNVYGSDSDIHVLRGKLQDENIIINVDGTQAVGHIEVDVNKIGADIYSFSGHKMFASQGIGVCYVKQRVQDSFQPVYCGGGSQVEKVGEKYLQKDFIKALESGTQNYAGILSLEPAIDFIHKIGESNIHMHLVELTQYLLTQLKHIKNIEFSKGAYYWNCYDGFGIISFKHTLIDSASLGFIFDQHNINVRTGDHCTLENQDNYVRVSMHIYNSKEDIDKLVEVLLTL